MLMEFSVVKGDITKVPSDLLLLKYAQSFYGADGQVASFLISSGLCSEKDIRPLPDDFVIIQTKGTIAPSHVMFLGTPGLVDFCYDQMRHFARCAIEILAKQSFPVQLLTTTVHGVGYGLDVSESLLSLIRGFQEGLAGQDTYRMAKITFVERSERTARTLSATLNSLRKITREGRSTLESDLLIESEEPKSLTSKFLQSQQHPMVSVRQPQVPEGPASAKKHVFVAMPFSEGFEDTYVYGIYGPVRRCGFICEKVNETPFTGDILQRTTERIKTSEFVIADLTDARPNVYLEVGYAWGKGVPVILLAREGEKLHFDVSTHRCIYYKSIRQLEKDLEKLIRGFCGLQDESS